MSLDRREFVASMRRLTPAIWVRLLPATFVAPPLLALALGGILPIGVAAMGGLFLIAVAPGAPLMIRNINRHVGLALLLSGAHFQNAQRALPAIAAYAVAAPLVTALYAKWMRGQENRASR